jgi:tRNA threonylcarbamoyladenosine biosynthesis protein TsaE
MSTANRVSFETSSMAQTRTFGKRLARLLRAGDVVLLQGPLGAGKTALTQGIGEGLSLESQVTSPTFILMAAHLGAADRPSLYHADLYRLTDSAEVEELRLEDQTGDGVLVVEWPERAFDELPAEHLLIVIETDRREPNARKLTCVAAGVRYQQLLDGLQARR